MNDMKNLHKFDKKGSLWYNDIVRVIRGYGKMKGYVLEYVCENEFKKLERALKKYNMLAFKKLNFEIKLTLQIKFYYNFLRLNL